MNAGEWLKFNLEERRKATHSDTISSGRKSRQNKTPYPLRQDNDDDVNDYPVDVPTLTLTESQQGADDIDEYEFVIIVHKSVMSYRVYASLTVIDSVYTLQRLVYIMIV